MRLTSRQSVDPVTMTAVLFALQRSPTILPQGFKLQAMGLSEQSYSYRLIPPPMQYSQPMSNEPPERLSFPCDYPIKVMVRAENGVRSQVDAIVERHTGPLDPSTVVERPSAQKNFIGITYIIRATSPEQIAQLFAALKLCPQVLLVL